MAKLSFIRPVKNVRRLHGLFKNRAIIGRMLKDIFTGHYKPSLLNVLLLITGFIYIVWPVDTLPDFLPLIGWLDDGAIIFFLAKRLLNEADRYLKYKDAQTNPASAVIPLP
jgi:uncharacterized membrane protein YkvA (DUF1232 family)